MEWAKKVEPSNKYSIRSGDDVDVRSDPTSYTPNAVNEIHLRVLEYGYKYRGLLVVARDAMGNNVGSWEGDEWMRPSLQAGCEGAIYHAHAAEKPYHETLRFIAPAAGAGPLTFKALIKIGDANTGAFFRPAQALVLQEGSGSGPQPTPEPVTDGSVWFKAEAGMISSHSEFQ